MVQETAMSAALKRAGMDTANSRLRLIARDALEKTKGNVDRALSAFAKALVKDRDCLELALRPGLQSYANQIYGLPEGGQPCVDGQSPSAADRQTNGGGASQIDSADNGPSPLAVPSPPGKSKRGMASILSVQATMRNGLMFTQKTGDGRFWCDVGWHELDCMDRDGALARVIKRKFGQPPNVFVTMAEFLTNSQFTEALDEARRQNDPT